MVTRNEDLKKPVQPGTLRKPCSHSVVEVGNGKTVRLACGRTISLAGDGGPQNDGLQK